MWKSSITPNHVPVDSGAHGLRRWAFLVPRGRSAPDARHALRCSPDAIEAFECRSDIAANADGRSREAAASSGKLRTAKPPDPIGVPTSRTAGSPSHRGTRSGLGTGAPGAPFGPELFPTERRSRYETRVYANLCPISSVDTSTSADKLRKGKKGLETNEFRAFWTTPTRLGSSSSVDPAGRGAGQRGENARKRAAWWRKTTVVASTDFDRLGAARGLGAPLRPTTGGSVTIASARISTAVRRLPGAAMACCGGAVSRRFITPACDMQVFDLGIFLGRVPSGHGRFTERPYAAPGRRTDHRMSPPARSQGGSRAASERADARAGSLPAQPLHHFSAVARFDSSSPQGIAVRGNQEKMR